MTQKVILFGPYPPPFGGVAIFVQTLFESLNKAGFDCELKIYKHGDSSKKHIHPDFTSVYSHFSHLGKGNVCVDSCSFFLEYPSIKPIFAWLLTKASNKFIWVKIIHDGTLPERYDKFSLFSKILFNISTHFVDEFIVVDNNLKNWIAGKINVTQKVSLVHSLLPLLPGDLNNNLSPGMADLLKGYDKLVCSIGVFIPNYGFKNTINAVELIRQESGLNIGVVLVDGTFARDNKYKEEILRQKDWVLVFENVPHSQVLNILKKSDVFVRAVASESYGLSRVEAIWCGTPVVATRTGETRGMLLYDFGDETQLIHQIKEAIFSPSVKNAVPFWAEQYQKEAEKNLTDLIGTINP